MRHIQPRFKRRRSQGAGLVELLIAVTIGLILIAGALSVFVNSRKTYRINQTYARMLENGTFALDEISRSLQLAGYWGRNSRADIVRRRTGDTTFTPIGTTSAATNECEAGWYANVTRRVEGLNDSNTAYSTTCLPSARYSTGTDVLVVRYAEPAEVPTASLQANTVYIRADPLGAEFFVGTTEPGGFSTSAANFRYRAVAYYVSDFSLTAGDGIPALKKVELEAGPAINLPTPPSANEIVVPGIENMQVQYGLSTSGDARSANEYRNAGNMAATDWDNVVSVRVWVLVRAEDLEAGFANNTGSFRLPAAAFTPAALASPNQNNGYRRLLMSRTVSLRNL